MSTAFNGSLHILQKVEIPLRAKLRARNGNFCTYRYGRHRSRHWMFFYHPTSRSSDFT